MLTVCLAFSPTLPFLIISNKWISLPNWIKALWCNLNYFVSELTTGNSYLVPEDRVSHVMSQRVFFAGQMYLNNSPLWGHGSTKIHVNIPHNSAQKFRPVMVSTWILPGRHSESHKQEPGGKHITLAQNMLPFSTPEQVLQVAFHKHTSSTTVENKHSNLTFCPEKKLLWNIP